VFSDGNSLISTKLTSIQDFFAKTLSTGVKDKKENIGHQRSKASPRKLLDRLVLPSVLTPHQLALWTSTRPVAFTCEINPPLGKCNLINRPIKPASVQWDPTARRWKVEWKCCNVEGSNHHSPNTAALDCSISTQTLTGEIRKQFVLEYT